MCGNEILNYRKALTEVGGDRRFNDFSRGFGHQAPHSGQLPQLLRASPGSRVRHDEDRIKILVDFSIYGGLIFGFQFLEHLFRYFFRDVRPDIYNLVIPFAIGDEAIPILLVDLKHLLMGFFHQMAFGYGNPHLINRDAETRLGRVFKS